MKLLNLKAQGVQSYYYSKVRAVNFSDKDNAKEFIENAVNNENYTSVELTKYITKTNIIEI